MTASLSSGIAQAKLEALRNGDARDTMVDQVLPPAPSEEMGFRESSKLMAPFPAHNEELNVAIGKARVEFEPLFKSQDGMIGGRSFKYAPLGEMVGVMEKALAKHGVGFVMPIHASPTLVTVGLIVQGHGGRFEQSMSCAVPRPEDKGKGDRPLNDTWVQELGRVTTYLRRYLVNSFFALDTVEDKDSQGVDERPAAKQPDERAETPAQREAAKERTKDAGNPPDPNRFKTKPPPADLKEALSQAKKNLGWTKEETLAFVEKNFAGKGFSDMSEAELAQLLGMMEDLYAAQKASGYLKPEDTNGNS